MEIGRVEYEGWIYGIGEWQYSKISKLLKSALEQVDYEYLDGGVGGVRLNGSSAMFDEDEENLFATFDLLADQVADGGRGVVLAKRWDQDGAMSLTAYELGPKSCTKTVLLPRA